MARLPMIDPTRLRAILQDHAPRAYYDREQRIIAEVWEALPELLASIEWGPIDTAPRDGSRVLAFEQGQRDTFIVWWEDGGWCDDDFANFERRSPAYWIALPVVPATLGHP